MKYEDALPIEEWVRAARVHAAECVGWFASALYAAPLHLSDALPAPAAIDRYGRVYFNPQWVARLYEACGHDRHALVRQLAQVWYHEVAHWLREHAARANALHADARLWNLAADMEINDYLPEGMAYPSLGGEPLAMLPRRYNLPDGEIAEWYYQRLVERAREQAQAGGQQQSQAGGQQQSQAGGQQQSQAGGQQQSQAGGQQQSQAGGQQQSQAGGQQQSQAGGQQQSQAGGQQQAQAGGQQQSQAGGQQQSQAGGQQQSQAGGQQQSQAGAQQQSQAGGQQQSQAGGQQQSQAGGQQQQSQAGGQQQSQAGGQQQQAQAGGQQQQAQAGGQQQSQAGGQQQQSQAGGQQQSQAGGQQQAQAGEGEPQGAPPCAPTPLSHPVGEGSGVRATQSAAGEGAIHWDEGSGVHGQARPWELHADDPSTNALSDFDRQALQEEVARRIVEHQKERGTAPAGWLRWAEAILKPKMNWREQLKRILRGVISEGLGHRLDYSYRRPHRRSAVYHPIYLPALQGEYKPRIACVVDTSGSISDRELMQSLAEVRAVLEALRIPVTIIPCDAVPYEAIRVFHGSDWLKVRQGLRGGGGTDMVAGLNAALALKPKPEAVIVLTDGHTPFPSTRPKDTAVIWAIWQYGDGEPPKPPMPPWRARDVVVAPIDAA
jgi:predicted metal-dependent peptidase